MKHLASIIGERSDTIRSEKNSRNRTCVYVYGRKWRI